MVIFADAAAAELLTVAMYFALGIPCVLGSRMLLNLREAADEAVVDCSREVRMTELSQIEFS